MNQFCASLGIKYPILQAPMTGTTTPQLAIETSRAGALGGLGLGALGANACQAQFDALDQQGLKTVNLNYFCHKTAREQAQVDQQWLDFLAPHFEKYGAQVPQKLKPIYESFLDCDWQLEQLLAFKPAAVSFHFGLPSAEAIQAIKQRGIKLLASATCLEEAQAIEAAGFDYIIAQGIEAGGHRGVFEPEKDQSISLEPLLTTLLERCQLPIIAAGGIMNGEHIKSVMAQGAAAVQMGTAFVLCPESKADEHYRRTLKSDAAQHTEVMDIISGRPARGIPNKLSALASSAPTMPDYPLVYDGTKQLNAAALKQGDSGFGAFWAGSAASLAREMPAAELVNTLAKEAGWV